MSDKLVWEENRQVYGYLLPAHVYDDQLIGLDEYGKYGIAALAVIENKQRAYWGYSQALYTSDGVRVADSLVEWGKIVHHLGWTQGGESVLWSFIPEKDEFDTAIKEAAVALGTGRGGSFPG